MAGKPRYIALFMTAAAMLLSMALHAGVSPADNYIRAYSYLDSTADNSRARLKATYYDGMGREVLSVEGATSMNGSFVGTRTDYARHGKIERKWLPVPGNTDCLNTGTYESHASDFYGQGEVPYTRYVYDDMCSSDLIEEIGPGSQWARHGIAYSKSKCYDDGEYSCLRLLVDDSDSSVYVDGVYPEKSLRVIETVNPDKMRILKFENRMGKTVMERHIAGDTVADTRFVYDRIGDLRYTISPEGAALLPTSGKVDDTVLKQYSQYYRYDYKHRVISSRMPGCHPTEYVYDKYGHLLLQADALQIESSKWLATFYDDFSRPVLQGLLTISGKSADELRATFADSTLTARTQPYGNGTFPKPIVPNLSFECLSIFYYDNYDFFDDHNAPSKALFDTSDEGFTATGLKTGEMLVISGECFFRAYKYDSHGNVTLRSEWDWYQQNIRLNAISEYDFLNQPTSTTYTLENVTEGEVMSSYKARFDTVYDDMGRKVNESLSVNDGDPQTLCTYEYDAIGRLLHQWRGIEVDYGYDIRSHLTSITSDVFSEQSVYAVSNGDIANPSFIYINAATETWHGKGATHPERVYSWRYKYDGLGHLVNSYTIGGTMSETCDVDLDAKVRGIVRKYRSAIVQDAVISFDGALPSGVSDVSVPYYGESVGRFSPGSYAMSHDKCGRLVSDESRGISQIYYNEWGDLAWQICMSDNSRVQNTYAFDGSLYKRNFHTQKITFVTRVNSDGDTVTIRDVKVNNSLHKYFGPFELIRHGGKIHTSVGYYDLTSGSHRWYINNRLGSVMAVIDSAGNVLQRSGLYPSGTPFAIDYAGNDTPAFDTYSDRLHIGNRWLGQSGLDWYDNTARLHDPLLMRFSTPDAHASKYPGISPWAHCIANPVNLVDQDGNRVWNVDENGYFTLVSEDECKEYDRVIFVPTGNIFHATNVISDENFESVDLPANSILSHTQTNSSNKQFELLTIKGDDNGSELFELVCAWVKSVGKSTEFSLIQTGENPQDGNNYLTTSHEQYQESSSQPLYETLLKNKATKDLKFRFDKHNHINGSKVSKNDAIFKIEIIIQLEKLNKKSPVFFILIQSKSDNSYESY